MNFYFKENIVDNIELSFSVKELLSHSTYGGDFTHLFNKKMRPIFVGSLDECRNASNHVDACYVVISFDEESSRAIDDSFIRWEILIDDRLPNCQEACSVSNINLATSRVRIVIPSVDALYYALFIISNVKYRMGQWFYTRFDSVNSEVLSDSYYPIDLTFSSRAKSYPRASDLAQFLEAFLHKSTLIQFKDNINQNPLIYFKDGVLRPIFSFNRHVRYSSQYVLWPLSSHQKFGSRDFKDYFSNVHEKLPNIFWRGSTMGSINNKKGRALFFNKAIEQYKGFDPFVAKLIYNGYARFRFVMENYDLPFSDIGFSSVIPNFEYLSKPRVDLVDANRNLFHVALDGNDLPSALPWQLYNSNITFIPELNYESIFTYGLLPWVNFVPIRSDFSDLLELRQSLLFDRRLIELISSNARRYMTNFSNSVLQGFINTALVFHYSNMEC